MPLLDDARALLEIDRERRDIAREHAAVLVEAEERAQRLARLGDEERPKTLAFLNEAASLLPPPGTGAGATRPTTPLSSSGGGAAGQGGGVGGSRSGRTLRALRGTTVRAEQWIAAHCTRAQVEIPKPGALRSDETVMVDAWDCTVPFREMGLAVEDGAAIFLDPDAAGALLGPRSSSKSGAGAGRGSGITGTGSDQWLGSTPGGHSLQHSGGSSIIAPSPPSNAPTPDARLVQAELRAGFGMLAKELRAGGDLGLQIRRNGGL